MRSQSSCSRRSSSTGASPIGYITLLFPLSESCLAEACQACNLNLSLEISFQSPGAIDKVPDLSALQALRPASFTLDGYQFSMSIWGVNWPNVTPT